MSQIILKQMQIEDTERISRFLANVFRTNLKAAFIDPKLMEWKYFLPRPDWCGSRSYALVQDEKIISHFAVSPALFRSRAREVNSITMLDWAADREHKGAGVRLMNKFKEEIGITTSFHTGLSEASAKVLPKYGFEPKDKSFVFVKRVRPLKLFLSNRERDWKSPLRLIRDFKETLFSPAISHGPWAVEKVEQFDDSLTPVLNRFSGPYTDSKRSVALLNYMLTCPAAPYSAYILRESSEQRGYFILNKLDNSARIIDIFIDSGDQNQWQIAYSAATDIAATDPYVHSVFTVSTTPFLSKVLDQVGYKEYGRNTIGLFDPDRLLEGMLPINIQWFEADHGYLSWNKD